VILRSLLLAAALLCWAPMAAPTEPLRLVVGEMPPYAMSDDPGGPGALVELTQELGRRVGAPLRVVFYPWTRALLAAQQPRTLVLPLTRTAEREPRYRWMARIHQQKYLFVGRHGDRQLDDPALLRNARVVVVRGTPHQRTLSEAHYAHVAECTTIRECLRMVKKGIADATYGAEDVHRYAARLDGNQESEFAFSPVFRRGEVWLAGSTDISEDEARQWRAALEAARADGALARILRKYGLSGS